MKLFIFITWLSTMKTYNVRITESVKQLSTRETYLYYCLLLHTNFNTMVSHVKQKTLSKFSGIDIKLIQDYLKHIESLNIIKTKKETIKSENYVFDRNTYFLSDEHFVMISNKLFSESISKDLIGFLILFKCLCMNETNICFYSIRQMEDNLKISKNTINKYLKEAKEKGYIIRDKKKKAYKLTRNDLFIITPENLFAKIKRFYPEILTDEDLKERRLHLSFRQ